MNVDINLLRAVQPILPLSDRVDKLTCYVCYLLSKPPSMATARLKGSILYGGKDGFKGPAEAPQHLQTRLQIIKICNIPS